MMKFGRSVTFLAFVIVLLLVGTRSAKAESGKFPVGSYQAGPYTVTFQEDGTFAATLTSGAGVRGTYKISGDNFEVTDVDGDLACPTESVGKYTWKVEAEKLVFTLVDDSCEGRAEGFSMPLGKKEGK